MNYVTVRLTDVIDSSSLGGVGQQCWWP